MPLLEVQAALVKVFQGWGLPRCIKVDNGRPFADPRKETVPVLSLWLLALGIRVIFNRVRTPQDNAKVERSQGVMSNWTEWEKSANCQGLQARLYKEAAFHNQHFPVKRLGGKTRLEAFPEIFLPHRPYDPEDFDCGRALEFLAKGSWERDANSNGQFSFWGIRTNLGRRYAKHRISIKLNALDNQWNAFDEKGTMIRAFDTNINPENLWNLKLSGISMN